MVSDGVLGDDVLVHYSVPVGARAVYEDGTLCNPQIAKGLPKEVRSRQTKIVFTGSDNPSIPVNWRFAEAISSLKALGAALVDAILQRRYGLGPHKVNINTDHATQKPS